MFVASFIGLQGCHSYCNCGSVQHLVGTCHVHGTVLGAWEGKDGIGLVSFSNRYLLIC